MLTLPSRGFNQTLLGRFCFANLKGDASMHWTHGGIRLMILDLLGI